VKECADLRQNIKEVTILQRTILSNFVKKYFYHVGGFSLQTKSFGA